ncbi:MAG: hypothetical protein J5822_02260 [Eubacteriaceae bacterium]|nr:hypothetical protein [Eubacteriaceae bacterium]
MTSRNNRGKRFLRLARELRFRGLICGFPGTDAENTLYQLLKLSAEEAAKLLEDEEKLLEEREPAGLSRQEAELVDYGVAAFVHSAAAAPRTVLSLAEGDYYRKEKSPLSVGASEVCSCIRSERFGGFVFAGAVKRTAGFLFVPETGGDGSVYFVKLSDWTDFIRFCAHRCAGKENARQ